MTFKKLLLATAVAAVSSSALAMQAMDDESLAETTGQDGLTIGIEPPAAGIGGDIILHDNTGVGTLTNSGAILINDFLLRTAGTTTSISILIDATGDANNDATTTDPMLNIAINLPASTIISTGSIHVADSNNAGVAVDSTSATLLNNMNITLGATTLNMQLGNEPQGFMLLTSTSIAGGITLSSLALNDANSGGAISATSVSINDFGFAATNLNVRVGVDATASALRITLTQLGTAGGLGTGGLDISMGDVGLGAASGSATDIGDVDMLGLNLNGAVITITGH
jgi:hypothetical protein